MCAFQVINEEEKLKQTKSGRESAAPREAWRFGCESTSHISTLNKKKYKWDFQMAQKN